MSIAMDYSHAMPAVRFPAVKIGLLRNDECFAIADELSAIQQIGVKARFSRNQTIFSDGDDAKFAYKLTKGTVRLCKYMADGRRQIANFMLPGDIFAFLQFGTYHFSAEAIGDVEVLCYPQAHVERIAKTTPDLRRNLLFVLSRDMHGMQDHLMMLGRQTAKERVASFLLWLADRTHAEEGETLPISMNRQDVADYLGLTIETVCRVLGDFKRKRIIAIPNLHEIVARDIERLHTIADGDDQI